MSPEWGGRYYSSICFHWCVTCFYKRINSLLMRTSSSSICVVKSCVCHWWVPNGRVTMIADIIFLVSIIITVTINFQRATWPLALLTSWPRIRPQGASTLQSLVMRTAYPCSSSSCSTSSCSVTCANTRKCSKIRSIIRYFKRKP